MTEPMDLSCARVGVIGGSGLYAMPGLEELEERPLETLSGVHRTRCVSEDCRAWRSSSWPVTVAITI